MLSNNCHRQYQQKNPFNKEDKLKNELYHLFNKRYKFHSNALWHLPEKETWFKDSPWTNRDLERFKKKLNICKSQLNDFDIEDWSSHTRRRNPAGEVSWTLKSKVNPEFLTQAWTKFYECAYTYNIVPNQAISINKIVSVHLCEAPGAFITSFNHYLKLHHSTMEWKWMAATLNPYYEGNSPSSMISDDRFMFHTLANWNFGVDNTGNLMDWKNSQDLIKKAKLLGKVFLVTADGSIDCLQKPEAQEDITSALHYCEIVTALQILSKGGTLILKLFTIFEHNTINLLFLLNLLFEEVNIYKPVTSRAGNSEVYAVCLRYTGWQELKPYIPFLESAYGTELYNNCTLFPLCKLPRDFLRQVKECAWYFGEMQCRVIKDNLRTYRLSKDRTYNYMKELRKLVASEFINHYRLNLICESDEILKGILHEDHKINTNPRYHRGSYTDRQHYNTRPLTDKFKILKSFLENDILPSDLFLPNDTISWIPPFDSALDIELTYIYGKPVTRIKSSKFICMPVMKLYQSILAEEQFSELCVQTKNDDKNGLNSEYWKVTNISECDFLDYDRYEKEVFRILYENLQNLTEGISWCVENFSLLTHFSVGLIFLIGKCFERTGFINNTIIFSNLKTKVHLNYMTNIKDKLEIIQNDSKSILSVLPVQTTNTPLFCDTIIFYNNTVFRNKCIKYLDTIEQHLYNN